MWELFDHGLKQFDDQGRLFYAYGGDFGEARGTHGANFVCDGLCFPDRKPSPGLIDVRSIIQPVEITREGTRLSIRNRYDFIDLSHLDLTYTVHQRGHIIMQGALPMPVIQAGTEASVDISQILQQDSTKATWCIISAVHKGAPWVDAGHEIAWAEFLVTEHAKIALPRQPSSPPVVKDGQVQVGPATFDATTGQLVSVGAYPVSQAHLDLWRAPTDNDNGQEINSEWPTNRKSNVERWLEAGLDRVQHHVSSISIRDGSLVIESQSGCAIFDRYLDVRTTFSGMQQGEALHVRLDITPRNDWTDLQIPRLGYTFAIDAPKLNEVEWFGLGPGESYPDTRSGVRMGLYNQSIAEIQTPYVMPQENGNRMNVEFADITDPTGKGVRVEGDPNFNFSVRRWSNQQLHQARRLTELEEGDTVYLHVDWKNSGIGSASTGPGVLEPYRIILKQDEPISFEFTLKLLE